ncbi:MAG: acetolactate synthase large subunit [Actinomycetota bacterium]
MNAAELLVRCLENEGVEYVFGIPGEETIDLNEAIANSDSITFVPTRHEQGAAFMANAYGRVTGRPGVCLGTLGPGSTNLATGVADAFLDLAPMVALTGQAPLAQMHKQSHQYIDVMRMLRPVTKWNARVHDPATVPEEVRKAFAVAAQEKPGATHLELPMDVMRAEAAGTPLRRTPGPRSAPLEEEIARAVDLIRAAEHPVVLAGNGVVRQHAAPALRDLCDSSGLGVINTFMSKGVMEHGSGCSLFTAGLARREYLRGLLGTVDLVVCVGYDLIEWSPQAWNPDGDLDIVCVDTVPAEIDAHYVPRVQLIGDIASSVLRLAALLEPRQVPTATRKYEALLDRALRSGAGEPADPATPQAALLAMREAMDRGDVLISDVGAHKLWVARFWPTYEPNTVLMSNGASSMGFALPAGIAVALEARDHRRVVTLSGDGGFLMNIQELETAKRLGVRLTNIVWTDGAYGVIEVHQRRAFGHVSGTRFGNPDFVALADAFGVAGFRASTAAEVPGALRSGLAHEGTSVVEIAIDARENDRLADDLSELVARGR